MSPTFDQTYEPEVWAVPPWFLQVPLRQEPAPALHRFRVWFRAPNWMRKPRGRVAVSVEAENAGAAMVLACSSGLYAMAEVEGSVAFVYYAVEPE